MVNQNRLGEYLKTFRKERKLSLADVASQTEISTSYLNRLEHGSRSNPSIFTVNQLSNFFGITSEEVMQLAGLQAEQTSSNGSSQELSVLFDSASFVSYYGKKIGSDKFKLIIEEMIKVNIDNFSEVMSFLNHLKEVQNELR